LPRREPSTDDERSPRRRRGAPLVVAGLAAVLSLLASTGTAWAAANWTVKVATVNSGEAKAQALPAAPTATSACANPASGKKVTVTWAAITHASGYGVYQATAAATGPYTLQMTVTTTTWTSAALAAGNYWYEVVANIGSWASANSAATTKRIISSSACS
jgi:hypothetical protein